MKHDRFETWCKAIIGLLVVMLLFLVAYQYVENNRVEAAATRHLVGASYNGVVIVKNEFHNYVAGSGCLGMDRQVSAAAVSYNGKFTEILLCCRASASYCSIESTYQK